MFNYSLYLFGLFFFLGLLVCVYAVLSKNLVHCSIFLALFATIISFILGLLGAEFLALVYLSVYVGAVIVFFLFIVLLFNLRTMDGENLLIQWKSNSKFFNTFDNIVISCLILLWYALLNFLIEFFPNNPKRFAADITHIKILTPLVASFGAVTKTEDDEYIRHPTQVIFTNSKAFKELLDLLYNQIIIIKPKVRQKTLSLPDVVVNEMNVSIFNSFFEYNANFIFHFGATLYNNYGLGVFIVGLMLFVSMIGGLTIISKFTYSKVI